MKKVEVFTSVKLESIEEGVVGADEGFEVSVVGVTALVADLIVSVEMVDGVVGSELSVLHFIVEVLVTRGVAAV